MIDEGEATRLREKLTKLEEIFVEIRDHREATMSIRGLADFGEGRVQDFKTELEPLLQHLR